jgi:TetR/AcrR family transcriptional regulator, tetracycline repressor protein
MRTVKHGRLAGRRIRMAATAPASPRRGRGARAGLDRERILAAARGMDPGSLTMQSLAAELGVDRKALNYHVSDRESLLEMLAIDAFLTRFTAIEVDPAGDWRDACRALAAGIRESVLATGEWVSYYRFTTQQDLAAVGPAEIVAERMLSAGFDHVTVSRGMHLLITICTGFARDAVLSTREGGHPQIEELRRILGDSPEGYTAIRDLVDARVDNYGDEQFAFDLAAFFAGMDALLPRDR